MGGSRDVTLPRKELSRRRSLPIAKEWDLVRRMVGGLAHEISNHLAPVLLNLSVLRPRLRDDDHEILGLLEAGVRRSSRLIRELEWILDPGELEPVECDLRQILRAAEKVVAEVHESLEISTILPDEPLPLKGDPIALLHALTGLGHLCCHAKPEGPSWLKTTVETPAAEVRGAEDEPGALWTIVHVCHPGVGATPGELEALGRPTARSPSSSMRVAVDLVVLDNTIRNHGGSFEVDVLEGPTTSYRIRLPSIRPAFPIPDQKPATAEGNGTILVVDDEPAVRRVIKALLEIRGYDVLLCKNGREGLAAFRSHRSEVRAILTDVSMPVMGGVEFGLKLRRSAPDLPLIFMTGAREDKASALNADGKPVPVLSKPFSGEELLQALESAFTSGR